MARQKGPIPLVGRIGDLSFYEDRSFPATDTSLQGIQYEQKDAKLTGFYY